MIGSIIKSIALGCVVLYLGIALTVSLSLVYILPLSIFAALFVAYHSYHHFTHDSETVWKHRFDNSECFKELLHAIKEIEPQIIDLKWDMPSAQQNSAVHNRLHKEDNNSPKRSKYTADILLYNSNGIISYRKEWPFQDTNTCQISMDYFVDWINHHLAPNIQYSQNKLIIDYSGPIGQGIYQVSESIRGEITIHKTDYYDCRETHYGYRLMLRK